MGCVMSSNQMTAEEEAERQRASKLDKKQLGKQLNAEHEIKVLLLGTGDSGKTTVFKQMQIIYATGFSRDEKAEYVLSIRKNVIEQMQYLITACYRLKFAFESDIKETVKSILRVDPITFHVNSMKEIEAGLIALWGRGSGPCGNKAIAQAFANSHKFYLGDSAKYFLDQIETIFAADYNPTVEDMLKVRVKTTGISEAVFFIQNRNFKFIDVGGQRNERRKWIHCFDKVNVILFITSLAAYDQPLFEDESENRLLESLEVFKSTLSKPEFEKIPIILFLNMYDIFCEKLKTRGIDVLFPDYTGGPDPVKSSEYIKSKFLECSANHAKTMFVHTTIATNTENLLLVWEDVLSVILQEHLEGINLF